jgi:hypothetical protein
LHIHRSTIAPRVDAAAFRPYFGGSRRFGTVSMPSDARLSNVNSSVDDDRMKHVRRFTSTTSGGERRYKFAFQCGLKLKQYVEALSRLEKVQSTNNWSCLSLLRLTFAELARRLTSSYHHLLGTRHYTASCSKYHKSAENKNYSGILQS